jgi:hypothetical protein
MDGWEKASSVEGVKDFFVSPPPLPEDPAEESGNQEETPPPLPQDEKPKTQVEYSFPVRFEVEWGTSFAGCEADLYHHKDKIKIEPNSLLYDDVELDYRGVEIYRTEQKKIVAKVPPAYDLENKSSNLPDSEETFAFISEKEKKDAVNAIEYAKNTYVGKDLGEKKFNVKWGYLMQLESVLEVKENVIKIDSNENEDNKQIPFREVVNVSKKDDRSLNVLTKAGSLSDSGKQEQYMTFKSREQRDKANELIVNRL